jgi:N-acetylglucosaminyldiphosphoundecaprenol N-acetyl-beta-D-mannosaminyltransferase
MKYLEKYNKYCKNEVILHLNMNKKIKIFDIPFNIFSFYEILNLIKSFLNSNNQHHFATPNPEFLLESLGNSKFKKILQNTSLNTPDGTGILWAASVQKKVLNIKNKKLRIILKYPIGIFYLICLTVYPKFCQRVIQQRITGTDLMATIFQNFPDKKIFLLGAKEGIAEKATFSLCHSCENRNLNHVKSFAGSPKESDEPEIISKINRFSPDILFVAFGSPNQEIWINKNLSKIPSVKIAIGVGGAFDFFAGEKKRAPKFFQKLGIEWLYRLIIEPQRWKRIFKAVFVFPWKFLRSL